jgi:hypothetical protein
MATLIDSTPSLILVGQGVYRYGLGWSWSTLDFSLSCSSVCKKWGKARRCDGENEVITGHSAASVWSGRVTHVLQICAGPQQRHLCEVAAATINSLEANAMKNSPRDSSRNQ